jgi:hypothetical protein
MGARLVLASKRGVVRASTLKPGSIIGGQWASSAHCNTKVDPVSSLGRRSWTVYLDGRIFSKRYRYIVPNNFKQEYNKESL